MIRCLECKHYIPKAELIGVCMKAGNSTRLANDHCMEWEPVEPIVGEYTIDVASALCRGCNVKKECLEDGELDYCPFH